MKQITIVEKTSSQKNDFRQFIVVHRSNTDVVCSPTKRQKPRLRVIRRTIVLTIRIITVQYLTDFFERNRIELRARHSDANERVDTGKTHTHNYKY